MRRLILQAPGAAVTMSGACDCCRYILTLPIPPGKHEVCGVELVSQPLLGTAGFGTVGGIPGNRDHSLPCWAGLLQRLGRGTDTGLDRGSGKSPCLCPCPLVTAGVCCGLTRVQGEEMSPVGRAHAATASPFASEEPWGNY